MNKNIMRSTQTKQHTGRRVQSGLWALPVLALLGVSVSARADNPKVTLVVAKRGTLVMELYPDAAPKTVAHILALVNKKFYDGTKIHRVVPGFVVQWGDPESKNATPAEFEAKGIGSHGSGQNVPLEAKLLHEKDTLGLARSQNPDSGDSQMYINFKANHQLDGQYCVFGKVIKGAELASQFQVGDVITSFHADGGGKDSKDGKDGKDTKKPKGEKTAKSK